MLNNAGDSSCIDLLIKSWERSGEKNMEMLQKKGICVALEGFFKQSSFSCKTSAAIILIKYMENIQT